jgi:hypothetical protein
VLGMGQTPVDPKADPAPEEAEEEPPARGGCASCSIGARSESRASAHGSLAVLLLGVALHVRAARRRRTR